MSALLVLTDPGSFIAFIACTVGFFHLLAFLTPARTSSSADADDVLCPRYSDVMLDYSRPSDLESMRPSECFSDAHPRHSESSFVDRKRGVSIAASVSVHDDAASRPRRVSVAASVSYDPAATRDTTSYDLPEATPSTKHAPCQTCQHVPVVYMLPIVLPCACHAYVGPEFLPPSCCIDYPHCQCTDTPLTKHHRAQKGQALATVPASPLLAPVPPLTAMNVPAEYLSRRIEDYPMAIPTAAPQPPTKKSTRGVTKPSLAPQAIAMPDLIQLPTVPTTDVATRPRRDRSLFRARLWIGKAFEHEDGSDEVYVMRVDVRTTEDANVMSPTGMWDVTVTYQEFERLYQALIDEVDGEPVAIPALELSTVDEEDLWHRRRTALQAFVDAITSSPRLANADCVRKLCQMW